MSAATRGERRPNEFDETIADPLALFHSEADVPPRVRVRTRQPGPRAATGRTAPGPAGNLRPFLALAVVAVGLLVAFALLPRAGRAPETPRSVEPTSPPVLATAVIEPAATAPDPVPPPDVVTSAWNEAPQPTRAPAATRAPAETLRVTPAAEHRPLGQDVIRQSGTGEAALASLTPAPSSPAPATFETNPAVIVTEPPPQPEPTVHVEAARVPDPPREATDRERIQALLNAYTAAYERFDTVSAASLWPGVDARGLSRAFSTLSRQSVSFDSCDVNVYGSQATARCSGAIEYVRRVGDTTPQSRSTAWVFALDRQGRDWRITNVTAR